MATAKIPKHNLSEKFQGESILLWPMSGGHEKHPVDYAHRDDYYMFMFLEQGYIKIVMDFDEYEVTGPTVGFTLPEQVHMLIDYRDIKGWILVVDRMFINPKHEAIFQESSLKGRCTPNSDQLDELRRCISMLDRRINNIKHSDDIETTRALISSYIGLIAEVYQSQEEEQHSTRAKAITAQFKLHLTASYKTAKRPSQYAAMLNITPIYLNEVIKRTMGITVSRAIHNHVIVHAKRLLYYTDLSIKHIAMELGYDDWAYFTRLFRQITTLSPTEFRSKYLK